MSSIPSSDAIGFNVRQRRDYPARKLASLSAPGAERVLYECPVGKTAEIRTIHIASTHTGSEALSIWHVRPNESTSLGSALFFEHSISAKDYVTISTVVYMIPGEQLVVKAGAVDRITVTIYGIER